MHFSCPRGTGWNEHDLRRPHLVATAPLMTGQGCAPVTAILRGLQAGLGGGMGVFLAGPLMEELKAAANGRSALLGAARRILEILVPLVYRPAMKVTPHLPSLSSPPHQLLPFGLTSFAAHDQDEAPVGQSVSCV